MEVSGVEPESTIAFMPESFTSLELEIGQFSYTTDSAVVPIIKFFYTDLVASNSVCRNPSDPDLINSIRQRVQGHDVRAACGLGSCEP